MGQLKSLGEQTIGKLNGHDAIVLVKERLKMQLNSEGRTLPFNLIILDYQMPELNGAQTCKLILDTYKDFMEERKTDSVRQAFVRSQIFEPEVLCCTAYEVS